MKKLRIGIAGEGAFGRKHIEALRQVDEVQISWLIGNNPAATRNLANIYSIPHWSNDLNEALHSNNLDAVILATPTPIHAQQANQVMAAGKHVLVEIPMADNLSDANSLVDTQRKTGVIAMAGHVRRFNPSHQWIRNKIRLGELQLQQMNVQTYFFRRRNVNALGEARQWVDHLLWHHACHSVDLFQYQTAQAITQYFALQGPNHPELGIAMDLVLGLKVPTGAVCNISLSFNNEGADGSIFRYICDKGTFTAHYDELRDCNGNLIDLTEISSSTNGIELMDREFVGAIRSGKEPNASLAQCFSTMKVLHQIERAMEHAV